MNRLYYKFKTPGENIFLSIIKKIYWNIFKINKFIIYEFDINYCLTNVKHNRNDLDLVKKYLNRLSDYLYVLACNI